MTSSQAHFRGEILIMVFLPLYLPLRGLFEPLCQQSYTIRAALLSLFSTPHPHRDTYIHTYVRTYMHAVPTNEVMETIRVETLGNFQ